MTGILRKFAAVILAFGCFISLASCSGNNTAAVAKESKIAQDNSLITGEDEITTQNDVSKDEFERQGIIEQVKQDYYDLNADRATDTRVTMSYNQFTDQIIFDDETYYTEDETLASFPLNAGVPAGVYYNTTYTPGIDGNAEIFYFPTSDDLTYDAAVRNETLYVYINDTNHGYVKYNRYGEPSLAWDEDSPCIYIYKPEVGTVESTRAADTYNLSDLEYLGTGEMEEEELFAMFPMSDAQAEQANENTAVVNENKKKNLYSMDGIENKTYEIIDRIYEDIMNVSNAANVFPYADKYGTVINSMDDVVANYAHNIVYEDSLGTSLRDAIRISVEDDLLNDAHGYEYVTYDSLLSNAIVTIEFMVLDNQELHDALNERNIETIDSRYDFFSIAREYADITYRSQRRPGIFHPGRLLFRPVLGN